MQKVSIGIDSKYSIQALWYSRITGLILLDSHALDVQGNPFQGPVYRKKGPNFSTGGVDTSSTSSAFLGPIKCVQLSHDNSGIAPAWTPEKFVLA